MAVAMVQGPMVAMVLMRRKMARFYASDRKKVAQKV
jgi:hypothetical protein